ncbi:hypothetical protein QTI51_09685 [Variovorax sp. J22G73]|uniref:hypothetical protein n=1 Tax=unclassified Variovorax TaxID=663243 RepID=UPI002578B1C1|nr:MULTISPECIES: hypothetical protein [unclassified Variovorax]MDM0006429.1 hypothetical protein [Variovorax sp. J22R203]MDM0097548.1 hypothetical protein [Variovorax sp. J22G73]
MLIPASLRKLRIVVPTSLHDLQHKGEHFFHMAYLGFTYVEGHGWHCRAAGMLFMFVFAGVFVAHGEVAE